MFQYSPKGKNNKIIRKEKERVFPSYQLYASGFRVFLPAIAPANMIPLALQSARKNGSFLDKPN